MVNLTKANPWHYLHSLKKKGIIGMFYYELDSLEIPWADENGDDPR